MAHQKNLAVQILSSLPLMICLEHLLQTLDNCFAHSQKKHLKFTKLIEMLETKGDKILQNVKTRWFSMLSLAKRLMAKYKTLLLKMALDNLTNQQTKQNYEHLCDLQILLGLACIFPLLEFMHALIKFAHMWDVFMCDLVVTIKVCQCDMCNMYLEQSSNFIVDTFWAFKSLLECKHENIHMKWILDFNSGLQHLAFEVNG
jgi:hypothetical protein